MSTIREHFDVDPRAMTVHAEWGMSNASGTALPAVTAKVFQDFEGNSKYWSFFIPTGVDIRAHANAIFTRAETAVCALDANGDGVYVEVGLAGYSERATSTTLSFTKRILLYVDAELTEELRTELNLMGLGNGFFVLVRDRAYAAKRAEHATPTAFISHDSDDKDALVRDLARELSALTCPVWYDEYSLKVGDSLRASIEKGLKETNRCILVLSPAFLGNKGWGKAEFDSIFTREILEERDVILPIWHNVGVKDVYQYSPRLADKVGLSSSIGAKALAGKLSAVIRSSVGGPTPG